MQLPRDNNDLFIIPPSWRRLPVFLVFEARSDPARSINDNLPILMNYLLVLFYGLSSLFWHIIYRIACDRDEC